MESLFIDAGKGVFWLSFWAFIYWNWSGPDETNSDRKVNAATFTLIAMFCLTISQMRGSLIRLDKKVDAIVSSQAGDESSEKLDKEDDTITSKVPSSSD